MLGSTGLELVASVMAIAASVISPVVGLIALAFVAPIARPLVIPLPGLYVVMMGAMIFGLILRLPIDRPRLRRPAAEVLLLAGFVLYVGADVAAGRLDGSAGSTATAIASAFARLIEALLALGVGYVVLRGRSPYPVLAGLLLSAIVGSCIALSQVVGAEAMFGNLVPPTELAARITGAFDDPNYFGSYLAAMSALAIGCRLEARGRLVRATLLGIIALLSVTLLFTQSRGALVAFMAGLVVIAFTRSRRAGLADRRGHRPGRGGGLPGVQRVALRGGGPQQRDGYGRSRRGVAGGACTSSPHRRCSASASAGSRRRPRSASRRTTGTWSSWPRPAWSASPCGRSSALPRPWPCAIGPARHARSATPSWSCGWWRA